MQPTQNITPAKLIHGSSIDYQDRRKRLRQLPPSPPPGLNPFHAPTINALEGMFERVLALASASNKPNSSTSDWLPKSNKKPQETDTIPTLNNSDLRYSTHTLHTHAPPSHSPNIWSTLSDQASSIADASQNTYRYMIPPTTEGVLEANAIQKNSSLDILSRKLIPPAQQDPAARDIPPPVATSSNAPAIATPQKRPLSPEQDDDVVELLSSDEDETDEGIGGERQYKLVDEEEEEEEEEFYGEEEEDDAEDYDETSDEDNQRYSDNDGDYEPNPDSPEDYEELEYQNVRPRSTDHYQNIPKVVDLDDSEEEQEGEEQEGEEELQGDDDRDDNDHYGASNVEGAGENVELGLGALRGHQFEQGQIWNEGIGFRKPMFQDPNLLFQYTQNFTGQPHPSGSGTFGEVIEGDCIDEAILERDQSPNDQSDIETGSSQPASEISHLNKDNLQSGSYEPSSDDVVLLLDSDGEDSNNINQSDPASSEFYDEYDEEGSEDEMDGEGEGDELESGGEYDVGEEVEEGEDGDGEDEIGIGAEEEGEESEEPQIDLNLLAEDTQGVGSNELETGFRNEMATLIGMDMEVGNDLLQYDEQRDNTGLDAISIGEFQVKDAAMNLDPVSTSFGLQVDANIGQPLLLESNTISASNVTETSGNVEEFSNDHISLLERLRSGARETNVDLIPREISPDIDLDIFLSHKAGKDPIQPIPMPGSHDIIESSESTAESQDNAESSESTKPSDQSLEEKSNITKLSESSPRKARLTRTSTMARTIRDGLAFIEQTDSKSSGSDSKRPTLQTVNTQNISTDGTPLSPTVSVSDGVSESGSSTSANARHKNEIWLLVEEARAFCSGLPRTTPGSSSAPVPSSHSVSPTKKPIPVDTVAPLPTKSQPVGSSPSKSTSYARRRISFGETHDSASESQDQQTSTFSIILPSSSARTGVVDLAAENVIQSTLVGNHALRSFISTPSPVGLGSHSVPSGSRSNSQEPHPAPLGVPSQPITNPFSFGQIHFGGANEGKILGFNNSIDSSSSSNSINSGNNSDPNTGVGFSFGMSFVSAEKETLPGSSLLLRESLVSSEIPSSDEPVTLGDPGLISDGEDAHDEVDNFENVSATSNQDE
ncbi:hypothetical protein BGZ76_002925 [Entomortierella beljakovae]|nr:hypothetical protein BGZ76_002925 [Entomortierella beljakovae]